jgi:DNA-binding Lrp family transcriptional regulator
MAIELEEMDKRILDVAQAAFPLCPRPYAAIAQACGTDERDVQRRLSLLKSARVLRQISAIFDSKALGYRGALVAAQAPEDGLEVAAAIVSKHAGVSHNYEREHLYNLWFTLAVPPGTDLQEEADALGRRAGLLRWQVLPALRSFRIGVRFDLASGQARASGAPAPLLAPPPMTDPQDQAMVRALQEDLGLSPEPFAMVAQRADVTQAALFDWMAEAGHKGWLRRFAAVLRHREAGFGEGGMGVWAAPSEQVEAVGRAFAADPAVTHCYERPSFEGFPYRLFTMVHGKDRAECRAILKALGQRVPGWTESAVLFSVREFKKERVKYFLPSPPQLTASPA